MVALDYWWSDLKFNWKKYFTKRNNIIELALCVLFFIFVTYLFKTYLHQYELIEGIQLNDILLNHIIANDVSIYIFVLLYTTIFYNYLFLLAYPRLLVGFFIFYTFGLLIRFILLGYIHLEAPLNYQEFFDPILAQSTYNNLKITKDLFYSGHMVTSLCAYFAMPNKTIKKYYLVGCIVLSILLLIQHIHYTIDILGAVIIVLILYKVYFEKIYRNSKSTYQYSPQIINVQ